MLCYVHSCQEQCRTFTVCYGAMERRKDKNRERLAQKQSEKEREREKKENCGKNEREMSVRQLLTSPNAIRRQRVYGVFECCTKLYTCLMMYLHFACALQCKRQNMNRTYNKRFIKRFLSISLDFSLNNLSTQCELLLHLSSDSNSFASLVPSKHHDHRHRHHHTVLLRPCICVHFCLFHFVSLYSTHDKRHGLEKLSMLVHLFVHLCIGKLPFDKASQS